MEYNFNKPFYKHDEFLGVFSLSHGTLERYKSAWLAEGNLLSQMGHLPIQGYKGACWDPQIFLNWLLTYKIEKPIQYTHEKVDYEVAKSAITNLNQHKRKKII
jgi:hypothetical protein